MSRFQTYHMFRQALLAAACLPLLALSLTAQISEPDSAAQPVAGSNNARASQTQHHEAGSVEATAPGMRDRSFLRQAAVAMMSEIQLSDLALQKSSSDDVKQLASSITLEHAKILDGLRAVAESQGVMLPAKVPSREKALYDRLSGLSGEEFDREYTRTLDEGCHRDLRDFRSEVANTEDASLRSVTQDATAVLHRHIVVADQIARNKGVAVSHSARVTPSPAPQ